MPRRSPGPSESSEVAIENPGGLALDGDVAALLRATFRRYRRVIVRRQLSGGRTGSAVLEVHPVRRDGVPELPAVVKCAPVSLVQREWRAFQAHIRNRLPFIAAITEAPTLLRPAGWGALRYPLARSGAEVLDFAEYCAQPDLDPARAEQLLGQLLAAMDHLWAYHRDVESFDMAAGYDSALPVSMLLRQEPAQPGAARPVAAEHADDARVGEVVALRGVRAQRLDPLRRTLTAELPALARGGAPRRIRLSFAEGEPLPAYAAGQRLPPLAARVLATRASALRDACAGLGLEADPDGAALRVGRAVVPSPLPALPAILAERRPARVATVHGDLNLANILVSPEHDALTLIDFAEAREDHVLHDLIHLECEVLFHLGPRALPEGRDAQAVLLAQVLWAGHLQLAGQEARPQLPAGDRGADLVWRLVSRIRRAARRYLFDPRDLREYYAGLAVYLVGALRFRAEGAGAARALALQAAALVAILPGAPGQPPPPQVAELLAGGASAGRPRPAREAQAGGRLPARGRLPAGSRMPLGQNPHFIGRGDVLRQVAEGLAGDDAPGAVAVTGLGGVGKTQLASEFVYRYGRSFEGGVFWLSCASPEGFAHEVAACGEDGALGLPAGSGDMPLDERVAMVLAAWRRRGEPLLVLDSCESAELFEGWRGRLGPARILITSQRADWQARGVRQVPLDVLERGESLALLRAHQPDAEDGTLAEIAGALGDLPLALHLAGSYLMRSRREVSAPAYLAALRASPPTSHRSLREGGLLPTEHDPSVAQTFALSCAQLEAPGPAAAAARAILRRLACLAPGEPVPASLVQHVARAAARSGAGRPGDTLAGALARLAGLGIVRQEPGGSLRLHRLLAAYVLDGMNGEHASVEREVGAALGAALAEHNRAHAVAEPRSWGAHLRHLADARLARGGADAAELAEALAEHNFLAGDYAGARRYAHGALAALADTCGEGHPSAARARAALGRALLSTGDTDGAERALRAALAAQEGLLGDHLETAFTLNLLGFLLQHRRQLGDAAELHRRALRIRRAAYAGDHPEIVESLCNLAFVEYHGGDPARAAELLREALAVQRRSSGGDDANSARVLTNLGELLLAEGRSAEALDVAREALAIAERTLGPDHPETARTLCGLGEALARSGQTADARPVLERALGVFLRSHGPDHARTRRVQTQLDALEGG